MFMVASRALPRMTGSRACGIRHRRRHPQPGRFGRHPQAGTRRIPRRVWRHAPVPAASRPVSTGFPDRVPRTFRSDLTDFRIESHGLLYRVSGLSSQGLPPWRTFHSLRRQAKATRHGMTKRRIRREDITARHHIRIIRLIERLCLPHAKPAADIIHATPQTPATYWQGQSAQARRAAHRTDKTVSKR